MGHIAFGLLGVRRERIARLVEAIPDNWSCVSGYLSVDKKSAQEDHVAWNTGYWIGCATKNAVPWLVGQNSFRQLCEARPDVYGILIDRKQPHFVQFDEAGLGEAWYTEHALRMPDLKRVIAALIRNKYRGRLEFIRYTAHVGGGMPRLQCRVEMRRFDRFRQDGEEAQDNCPPEIRLRWLAAHHTREMIEPIEAKCRSLSLRELVQA